MHFLHDLQPNARRISSIKAIERVVVLIADPNRRRIGGGHAAEPDIRVRGSRTGLTGRLHARNLRAGCGAVCGNVLQAVQHIVGRAHIFKAKVGRRGVFKHNIALGIRHLRIGAGAAVHTLIDEGGKAARHVAHSHAVGQAAARQRRQRDIRQNAAVRLCPAADQRICKAQPLGQKVKGFLRGQGIEHLHRDRIDRARDTALHRHRAAGRHLAVIHRPGPAVIVRRQRLVIHRAAGHNDTLIHRRAIGGQRLEG